MSETILMRHGECVGNRSGVFNQSFGNQLTRVGAAQVLLSAETIGPVDRIYTGPSLRTRQSGEYAALVSEGVVPRVLPGIDERHLGIFENRSLHEIRARGIVNPKHAIVGAGGVKYVEGRYGAESFAQVEGRARKAWARLKEMRKHREDQRVLVILSGDIGTAMCAVANGRRMADMIHKMHFGNGDFATIDDEGNVHKGDAKIESARAV